MEQTAPSSRKFGVVVSDLLASQMALLLIKKANAHAASHPRDDVVVFYENISRSCVPLFGAAMHVSEAFAYDGILIATNLSTASKILNFPASPKKFFYVYDLEWTRLHQKDFRALYEIYGNPELTLLARSTEHAKVISDAWNRQATVINDFDFERIAELSLES